MAKMRNYLMAEFDQNLIGYGCSSHILNLLAQDIGAEYSSIQNHIIKISKYFRNHHLPKSWCKDAGGTSLVLPSEVRWNTINQTIKSYLKNWPILIKVCEEHREDIDKSIISLIQNLSLKRSCEDLLKKFQPIASSLDRIQANSCKIAECVAIWKILEEEMNKNMNKTELKLFYSRYEMALKPCHFAAFLLSPSQLFFEKKLTENENQIALKYIEAMFTTSFLPICLKFIGKVDPFCGPVMRPEVIDKVTDFQWWKSFYALNPSMLNENSFQKLVQLTTAVASSAGVERIFSTFGQVHSKLRNRLGVDKAAKLTFLFKQFN